MQNSYRSRDFVPILNSEKCKLAYSQVQQGFISEHHLVSHAHITFKNEFRVAVPMPSK